MRRIQKTALGALAAFALALTCADARAGEAARAPLPPKEPCGIVNVAAASDLTYAINALQTGFEKATGCELRLSLGSSGNFLTQIENGAPFDVFLSANIAYPKKLEADGLAASGSTYLYAVGKIVVWTRKDSGVDLTKGVAGLRDAALKKIAIANPAHAPYGRAAEEALRNTGVYDAVKDRLVLGENISQAAQFVESGNAGAGIIALSMALSPSMKDEGRYEAIPENLYTPIEQGAVTLLSAPHPKAARQFLDYLKSPATAALLEQYGFSLPAKPAAGGKR